MFTDHPVVLVLHFSGQCGAFSSAQVIGDFPTTSDGLSEPPCEVTFCLKRKWTALQSCDVRWSLPALRLKVRGIALHGVSRKPPAAHPLSQPSKCFGALNRCDTRSYACARASTRASEPGSPTKDKFPAGIPSAPYPAGTDTSGRPSQLP